MTPCTSEDEWLNSCTWSVMFSDSVAAEDALDSLVRTQHPGTGEPLVVVYAHR
jgi:hypothetical protein